MGIVERELTFLHSPFHCCFCACCLSHTEGFCDKEERRCLTKSEWEGIYRKKKLGQMSKNVRANIGVLCFCVLPIMCPNCTRWGKSMTEHALQDTVLVNMEAWVLKLAIEGHFGRTEEEGEEAPTGDGSQKKKEKAKFTTSHEHIAEWLDLLEELEEARNDINKGMMWDQSLNELATVLQKVDEDGKKKKLMEARNKKRGAGADNDDGGGAGSKRKVRKRLVVPIGGQSFPPDFIVLPSSSASSIDNENAGQSANV